MEVLGRFEGEVVKYDVTKGFGFIKIKDEIVDGSYRPACGLDDAMIHWKEIKIHKNGSGIAKLEVGEVVEFTIKRDERGLKAFGLHVVDVTEENEQNFNTEEHCGTTSTGYDGNG